LGCCRSMQQHLPGSWLTVTYLKRDKLNGGHQELRKSTSICKVNHTLIFLWFVLANFCFLRREAS
jgi:hypothetical protein